MVKAPAKTTTPTKMKKPAATKIVKPEASKAATKQAKKAVAKPAPVKKAATAKSAVPTSGVLTLSHLAAKIVEDHQLPKSHASAILTGVIDQITKHLKKGDKIRLAGLGILQVKKRAARMGRNPATGESIKIKASKKVAFRVAKDLKESI